MPPGEAASDRFLFAVFAVDMGVASAEEVAHAALAAEGGASSLAVLLVESGVLTEEQRDLVEAHIGRVMSPGLETVPVRRIAELSVVPLTAGVDPGARTYPAAVG